MSLRHALPESPRPRREKVFGDGRPRPLDRNAKVRIMTLPAPSCAGPRRASITAKITAKALAVLEALLWGFHNARSGLCFPSYETIAEAAGAPARPSPRRSRRLRTRAAVMGQPHHAHTGA